MVEAWYRSQPSLLSMTMRQNGDRRILIEDAVSGCVIAEIEISAKQFALALGHLSSRPCEVEWRFTGLGKKFEHKTEEVPFEYRSGQWEREKDRAKKAVAPYEIDGWEGEAQDLLNFHNRVKGKKDVFTVRFFKLVDATEEDVEKARVRAKEQER